MSTPEPRYTLDEVPGELAAEMGEAATADDAERIATAAFAQLRRVLAGSGGREDALPLLAADALLTRAFEQLARTHPGALAAAAERWGAEGRLAEMAAPGESG